MTLKKINESPRITDTILIEIETPDVDGCFNSNPYKVDRMTIYYVERDFLGTNFGEYEKLIENPNLVDAVAAAKKAVCEDPSETNLLILEETQNRLESSRLSTHFYYKDRIPVRIVGSEGYPAWLSTDTTNSPLTNVPEDEDGNLQFGRFAYEWSPEGSVREGDYFVCWTWTPNPAGESLSAHLPFKLEGDPRAVITIPSHLAPEDKYEILLERYLPEMYKSIIADRDITPITLQTFNNSVASGFLFIENMANQIIDLFDANALHESMLMYLSNLFNLKLKSSDPTLWRRQIKEAIPLFKKKGTRGALEDAFAQSGMSLNGYTQFWQLTSPYTWQESFQYDGTNGVFELEKENVVAPIDADNFGLWVRESGDDIYQELTSDYVSFETGSDFVLRMTWTGDQLSTPLSLVEGDTVRVLYEYNEVPNPSEQQVENYIRALPLGDQRDEADQDYPPKNWNVRLISQEDPMFDVLVPVRHPFADPLVFGWIRTEFPYGENIYNMEEYNGSARPSHDMCVINKDFLDPCGACLSSSYSVDIGIEELNNDRILEAQDILAEYMPFHAQLHALNFSGEVVEFVQSPVEQIDFLVTIDRLENVLSGQANPIFHRIMEGGLSNWVIDKEDLADKTTVLSGVMGTGYNDHVALITQDDNLESLGVILSNHILEILAPSANAGTYTIADIKQNTARVTSSVIEPVNESAFTFHLSNIIYKNFAVISQDDFFELSDSNIDFATIGVKTQWDVLHTPDYTGGAWKVSIPAHSGTPYEIVAIRNGVLELDDDGTLPIAGATGLTYTLLTDADVTTDTSTSGSLECERRGFVNINDTQLNREDFLRVGDFLFYNNVEYEIMSFDGIDFWIKDWTSGDVAGVSINTRRRLLRNSVGYFGYRGLNLTTFADHEVEFGIVNGSNPPSGDPADDNHFKENYLFQISGQFYKIVEWDGVNVKLSGREQSWTTASAGGTVLSYVLIHFEKTQVNVGFIVFDHLDRDGQDPVIREIYDSVDQQTAIVALSTGGNTGIQESVAQEEGISFVIERRDGEKEKGDI